MPTSAAVRAYVWLSLACVCRAPAALAFGPAHARPQHAVILLIDDLGYGDTGYMGAEFPTPTIDALAMGGQHRRPHPPLCAPKIALSLRVLHVKMILWPHKKKPHDFGHC